jgi:DNA-binding transcriptional MerR regulator
MRAEPLSVSELAEEIGVSRVTLWSWTKAGLVPEPRRQAGKRAEYDAPAVMVARALAASRGH